MRRICLPWTRRWLGRRWPTGSGAGGKGGNQAVAAARMGARVAMAGRVGRDRFGGMILAALDEAGVERSGVLEMDGASGMSVAIVDARGDYGAVIVSGVNREIGDVAVPSAKVVVLQNEVPEAVNLAVAEAAGDARVVLNAAPAREVDARLMARVDVLVVNRGEAAALAGVADPEAAAVARRRAPCGWPRRRWRSSPLTARGMRSRGRLPRGSRRATV